MSIPDYEAARGRMVREQLEARGIADPRVLAAFRDVPRHRFLDPSRGPCAYEDRPLAIGLGQSISQPFIVAYMAERLEPRGRKVLEIGTGSGYETAILSRLASEVFSVEVEPALALGARRLLRDLGAANVRLRVADGMRGWPEEAPFERIVCTAAVEDVPEALLAQLGAGGWFLGPVGHGGAQRLVRIERGPEGGWRRADLLPVLFVEAHGRPMEAA